MEAIGQVEIAYGLMSWLPAGFEASLLLVVLTREVTVWQAVIDDCKINHFVVVECDCPRTFVECL